MTTAGAPEFHVVLIRPSHYDDDGYVIQWHTTVARSNALATLNALALDCAEREVLGTDVRIVIHLLDETNTRIIPRRIADEVSSGLGSLVCFVGVQTNQYPRALDLARRFRKLDCQVCIGGFHVSGSLAAQPDLDPSLQEALDMGVSLFAGEAESRLETVLQDARAGKLKPVYNYLSERPAMEGTPMPVFPDHGPGRYATKEMPFDAGRGCPFKCTFCTVIAVQGNRPRARTADDIGKMIRRRYDESGIRHYFIADDNLARNRERDAILDRLIMLREKDGIDLMISCQVDAASHKLPGFIEKASRAGVKKAFLGLESVNPNNLKKIGKGQNQISGYRDMLTAWREAGIVTTSHYIVGFPDDTPESLRADIKTLQQDVEADFVIFHCLTPLPGSQDYANLMENGAWHHPDLNRYDAQHPTTEHPNMSLDEWQSSLTAAWEQYYSEEHIRSIMRRALKAGIPMKRIFRMSRDFRGARLEDVSLLDVGVLRRKYRRDRRPGLPLENPLLFYPRLAGQNLAKALKFGLIAWRFDRIRAEVERESLSA